MTPETKIISDTPSEELINEANEYIAANQNLSMYDLYSNYKRDCKTEYIISLSLFMRNYKRN